MCVRIAVFEPLKHYVAHWFTDIFRRRAIEGGMIGTAKLSIIVPDYDLKTVGVDFTCATDDGLKEAYHHGYQKGLAFLAS